MTGVARVIHVYYADRRTLAEDVAAALVTVEDRQRLTPSMRPRRRIEYLAARALLRHALELHTGRPAASFRIDTSAEGKPECVGGPAISVSHSGDYLVCALADAGRIGVDVETGQAQESLATLAERYFTPAEARWLDAGPGPEHRFRMLWVLKEAYLKGLGVGLAGGLATLECRIEPPAIHARTTDDSPLPRLGLLEGRHGYVGVAAFDLAPRVTIDPHRVTFGSGADELGSLRLLATNE